MSKIDELRNKLAEMFDKAESKEEIVAFTLVNEMIDGIQADTQKLEDDNRELLKDYKEMVKHTAIKATAPEVAVKSNPDFTFEQFLADYKPEQK